MTAHKTIQARHRARELAVQLLYSLDNRPGQDVDMCFSRFISGLDEPFEDALPAAELVTETDEVKEYLFFLLKGTWRRRAEADNLMLRLVTGWRPERMVAVDRAVLRLAIFEGFLEKNIPTAVAISEAIELARAFGTEESGRFVNGVLARVAQHAETEVKLQDAAKNSQITTDS